MRRASREPRSGWLARRHLAATLLLVAVLGGPAEAGVGTIELISRGNPPGDTTEGGEHAVSADGRYVAFSSRAANLVAGQVDRGGSPDVFLLDRLGPAMILVSRTAASAVTTGNNQSFSPSLSADGRYVAFVSEATDLVAGLVNASGRLVPGVFLFDRVTGVTSLVSRAAGSATTLANGPSGSPVVSADGRFVTFVSEATDLVTGQTDTNQASDVFLHDREAGTTVLVSRSSGSSVTTASGTSSSPVVSADGSFVAFVSEAPNLVAGQVDDANTPDVFLYRRPTGETTLVSRIPASAVTAGNGPSDSPRISADGAFVAFQSVASDLVAGQVDPAFFSSDVFLYERDTGVIRLVSRRVGSTADAEHAEPGSVALSANGRYVAFTSFSKLLTAGGLGAEDGTNVFLHDGQSGTTTLVSQTPLGLGFSDSPALSADGRFVAFRSTSIDLVVGQAETAPTTLDLFRYDRVGGAVTMVSQAAGTPLVPGNGASSEPVISADGRFVAFRSLASDLVAGLLDLNGRPDVYLHDTTDGTLAVSRRDPGRPGASGAGPSLVDQDGLSADGRYLVYRSDSANLVPGQVDANQSSDVFLHDRLTGATTLVSRAAGSTVIAANGESQTPVISADGRFVAFSSLATDLVEGQLDFNFDVDVLLHDREAGTTVLVSRRFDSAVTAGSHFSGSPVLSADGRFLAFESRAVDLVAGQVDTNDSFDVFLYDRVAGTTVLVSRTPASATTSGDASSRNSRISADGRFVAFDSQATNLVPGQSEGNADRDVFLFERETGAVTLVSRTALAATTGNEGSGLQGVSADGRLVLFLSRATDLLAGQVDTNGDDDVFIHDRLTGLTSLVSRTPASPVTTGSGGSGDAVMSADGRLVAFVSRATDLVSPPMEESGGSTNVFLHDREAGTTTLVSRRLRPAEIVGEVGALSPVISGDGRFVAFFSGATDLLPGQHDIPTTPDLFLYDRLTGALRLVSRTRSGRPAGSRAATANDESVPAALSADGTVLAFTSIASDLTADPDENGTEDVFVLVRPCPGTLGSRPSGPCPGPASRDVR